MNKVPNIGLSGRFTSVVALFAMVVIVGCGGGDDAMMVSPTEAAGEDCPDGGTTLVFGSDTTGDGEVDDIDYERHVCDGYSGDDGRSVLVESGSADECPEGGIEYTFGYDSDGDGEIDDIIDSDVICDGTDGDAGDDGHSVLVETDDAGEVCPAGGSSYTFGYDSDGDGEIDDVLTTDVVCDGDDGQSVLVESESASSNDCNDGGVTYTFGYDTDGDGEIDDVVADDTICNGADGQDGADGEDGEDGQDGEDGRDLLVESETADDSQCLGQGTFYTFGYDNSGDGQIDEIINEDVVCDGNVSSELLIMDMSVIYFADAISGDATHDRYLEGLEQLEADGYINLTEADSTDDVEDAIDDDTYDAIVFFHQNFSIDTDVADSLTGWVQDNGRLIFGTHTDSGSGDLLDELEVSFTGDVNQDEITFTTMRASHELDDDMALFTEPWNIHAVGLEAQGSSESICEFDDGNSCGVVGNQGRTLTMGFMSDTLPDDTERQIALNTLGTIFE